MNKTLARIATYGAVAGLVLGGAVAGANSASAATGAAIAPASGTANDLWNLKISQACSAGATNFAATIDSTVTGWTGIQLVGNTPIATLGDLVNTGAPISDSLAGIASANGLTLATGAYTITGKCQNALGTTQYDSFTGTLNITAGSPATFTYAAPVGVASTTTLAASATTVVAGTQVTFTSTTTSTATVAGTVNFLDGTTVLNASPITVSGGVASYATTSLTAGSHSITAVFLPTNPVNIATSTSAATVVSVNAPAQTTTTVLSSTPAAPTTADVVSLTATLTPATAAGTVTFTETTGGGNTVVGSSPVSGGTAAISLANLTAGAHSYTAHFAPTNPANYVASNESAITVNVTAFAGVTASENITTTVATGTLTITAGTGTVDLGTPVLNAANTLLITAPKDINTVTVTDTRAGNVGYTVSGVVGDFTSGTGNRINSENLGWTPRVVAAPAPLAITAGPVVAPGAGVAVGASTGAGLKTARTLATAASGGSVGTAQLSASLVLQAPTSTQAGTYNTTLTLTAI